MGWEVGNYRYPVYAVPDEISVLCTVSLKAALGRGPGVPKQQLI